MPTINPCYSVAGDPVVEGNFIYSTLTVFTYKNSYSSIFDFLWETNTKES